MLWAEHFTIVLRNRLYKTESAVSTNVSLFLKDPFFNIMQIRDRLYGDNSVK